MLNLNDLVLACDGQVQGIIHATTFSGFAFDSRTITPGQLFVAIVTEVGDGHRYIAEACRHGASGILCQHAPTPLPEGITVVIVPDTKQALKGYAQFTFTEHGRTVIGIAGTTGKTSTKEAVASVLRQGDSDTTVFASPKNQSGRFGLAIASGELMNAHNTLVLELAVDAVQEMSELCHMCQPSHLILTNTGAAYLDSFGTIGQATQELTNAIASLPSDGSLIYNADDDRLQTIAASAPCSTHSIGTRPDCDVQIMESTTDRTGTRVLLCSAQGQHSVHLPFIGQHHAYTAAIAALVGLLWGKNWKQIEQGLEQLEPLPGRTRLLQAHHSAWLLDDAYSSTPMCLQAALKTVNDLEPSRRILVLGGMDHLGEDGDSYHKQAGRLCVNQIDLLYTLGDLAHLAGQAAIDAGFPAERVVSSFTAKDIVRQLVPTLRSGDMVLLKASAPARLEHVATALLANPTIDQTRLPRQTQGWAKTRLGMPERPAWVEVDLEAIAQNIRLLTEHLPSHIQRLIVLKANGYGHGNVRVAQTALNNGGTWLGVACVGEAMVLRQAGLKAPILVLGFIPAWQAREAVINGVTAAVYSYKVAEALSHAARDLGRTAKVHIKVDTGMGRLGLAPADVLPFVQRVSHLPAIEIEGIFSHFASADEQDTSYAHKQLDQFARVLQTLDDHDLRPSIAHIANSAAILRMPESAYDMVRLGIAMYGLQPSTHVRLPEGVRPALAFKCQIAQVKTVKPGSPVGYGCTWIASRPSRIAVIPVGYADGFRRAPTNWGEVLVHGHRAPLVGRVCMDQSMIDVTDIPGVTEGDEVVLIGAQGNDEITAQEVADRLGTIHYEVVSEILARVPRMV